jgi:SAM-dependent methyltransferase
MIGLLQRLYSLLRGGRFVSSADYWRQRYDSLETSGPGSYGRLAAFKAEVLNDFVATHAIDQVIELGSGDGSQLTLARYPAYVGVDISPVAIEQCRKRFQDDSSKRFMILDDFRAQRPQGDVALSLDVIYHLVEDQIFEQYLRDLFGAARRYVVIYSSNSADIASPVPHVRHRHFTPWIEQHMPGWLLIRTVKNRYPFSWFNRKNTSFADFYIYERKQD